MRASPREPGGQIDGLTIKIGTYNRYNIIDSIQLTPVIYLIRYTGKHGSAFKVTHCRTASTCLQLQINTISAAYCDT